MNESKATIALKFARSECESTIPARFKRIVTTFPKHTAIVAEKDKVTFQELDWYSDDIARAILQTIGPGTEPVVLFIQNDIKLIAGMLGVLKTGKFFCVLNPRDPQHRMAEILKDLKARFIVTDKGFLAPAKKITPRHTAILNLDEMPTSPDVDFKNITIQSTDIAGVFYSSGSTGKPKGVPRDHAKILHRAWIDSKDEAITARDHFIQLRQHAFSGALPETMNALLNGGFVVMYNLQSRGIQALAGVLLTEGITNLRPPIELLRYLISSLPKNSFFPDMRCLILVGDVIFRHDIERFKPFFKKSTLLFNDLSSSETGLLCRKRFNFSTRLDEEMIPVGHPVEDKEVIILDDRMKKLPNGHTGQIAVRMKMEFKGYWNLPELSANKIIADAEHPGQKIYLSGDLGKFRDDGQLLYMGRLDHRVKILEYSVELSAIESAIVALGNVRSVAVTALAAKSGEKYLVAYYTTQGSEAIPASAIRQKLAQTLPGYMIPSYFIHMDQFPLTGSGKLKYGDLPKPQDVLSKRKTTNAPPHNAIEQKLVRIWKKRLQVKQIGINDDFFSIGGSSLSALSLSDAITQEYQIPFTPEDIFLFPTIAQQATYILGGEKQYLTQSLVPIAARGKRRPLFCISPTIIDIYTYKHLAEYLDADQPFYALYARRGLALDGSVISIIDEITHFINEIREVQPRGPYRLAGYSGGGKVAVEMAYQLQQAGESVSLIIMLDAFAPGYPQLLPWIPPRLYYILRVMRRVGGYLWKLWILDWKGKRDLFLSRQKPFGPRFDNWIKDRYREMNRPVKSKLIDPATEMKRKDFSHLDQYQGKTLLLRAKNSLWGVRNDPSLGWGRWIKMGLEIISIPGDHEAILFGPRAKKVAGIIQDHLNQVD
jgi:surfactin family lipopeptide synthetase A